MRPDVIHLWGEPWSLVALQAAWLRRRKLPGAALVLEVDQNLHKRPVAEQVKFLPRAAPGQVASFLNALDALVLLTRTTRDVREQCS